MIFEEDIQDLLVREENENLEFKEAKNSFQIEKLIKYCVALANEGGGRLVLGVTDKKPRLIIGSNAFLDTNLANVSARAKKICKALFNSKASVKSGSGG